MFYEKVKQYKIDDIICIDETSIKSLQNENSVLVERVRDVLLKHIHKKYLRNITCIFAISTKGVLGWKLYDKGGINSESCMIFYRNI